MTWCHLIEMLCLACERESKAVQVLVTEDITIQDVAIHVEVQNPLQCIHMPVSVAKDTCKPSNPSETCAKASL